VTLFLTGVFLNNTATAVLGPVNAVQDGRLAERSAIELLEHLSACRRRAARDLAPIPTARIAVVGEAADRFQRARRVLNHIADRCLFPGSR